MVELGIKLNLEPKLSLSLVRGWGYFRSVRINKKDKGTFSEIAHIQIVYVFKTLKKYIGYSKKGQKFY